MSRCSLYTSFRELGKHPFTHIMIAKVVGLLCLVAAASADIYHPKALVGHATPIATYRHLPEVHPAPIATYRHLTEVHQTPIATYRHLPEVHQYIAQPVVHKVVHPVHVQNVVQPVVDTLYKTPLLRHSVETPALHHTVETPILEHHQQVVADTPIPVGTPSFLVKKKRETQ